MVSKPVFWLVEVIEGRRAGQLGMAREGVYLGFVREKRIESAYCSMTNRVRGIVGSYTRAMYESFGELTYRSRLGKGVAVLIPEERKRRREGVRKVRKGEGVEIGSAHELLHTGNRTDFPVG